MTTNPPHSKNDIYLKVPIAPNANHRLRSTPEGKLPGALLPVEALAWLKSLQEGGRKISGIELGGPGDVMSSWDASALCLQLLKDTYPEIPVTVTCLGMGVADHVSELQQMGVTRVRILVDTVDVNTATGIYAWIRPGKKTVPLAQAAEILIGEQSRAVQALTAVGIDVVVQMRECREGGRQEVKNIAEKMSGLGASCMEFADPGADEENCLEPAEPFVQCAVVQGEPELQPPGTPGPVTVIDLPKPDAKRPNVAVASNSGLEVDLHLGQASQLLIYGPRTDGLACLLETRTAPASGDPDRWQILAETLSDCFVVLASHAGEAPRQQLAEKGVQVILTEDQIEGLVDVLYGGGKKGKCKK